MAGAKGTRIIEPKFEFESRLFVILFLIMFSACCSAEVADGGLPSAGAVPQSEALWRNEMESAQRAHQRQDYERARIHLETARDIADSFAHEDPRRFESALALGMVSFDLGDFETSLKQLDEAQKGYASLGSDYRRLQASALVGLGLARQRLGHYGESEQDFLGALTLTVEERGRGHLSVAQIEAKLGGLYLTQGRYADAIPLFKHALVVQEKDLGPSHADSKSTLQSLALAYRLEGDTEKANELDRRLTELQ